MPNLEGNVSKFLHFSSTPCRQCVCNGIFRYIFFSTGIIQQAAQLTVCESICSFCSRMKRGRLYACARREGYNVLAMGQHLDDLAER